METATARILDANYNRARESLRVMEDYARFGLDDAGFAETLKSLRHDLGNAMQLLNSAMAIIARDTPGDVGTRIATADEYHRPTAGHVVIAAGRRLTEALRVLEEYGKTINPDAGRRIESIRYRAYTVERQLVQITRAREGFASIRLYVLITESLCRRPWQDVVRAAADGGAGCFQLREKALTDRALLERAAEMVALCRELGAACIINDRADIAAAVRADGVHLGTNDIVPTAARRVVGPHAIVGASTHSVDEARAALSHGPDYIAVGPVFSSNVKPEYGISGPRLLEAVRPLTSLPIVAIGGITPDNVAELAAAGASCIAVCSAVIGAEDPAAAARAIVAKLN